MDQRLLLWLNGLRNPTLDAPLKILSEHGLWVLILLPLVLLKRHGRAIAPTLRDNVLAFFIALHVSEELLKPIVRRGRPSSLRALSSQLHVLGTASRSPSFPSGTATACAAATTLLWLRLGPRYGVPAALFTLLVSLSRCYVGAHWPTDLLGGWVLGAAVAYGVDRASQWIAAPPQSSAAP